MNETASEAVYADGEYPLPFTDEELDAMFASVQKRPHYSHVSDDELELYAYCLEAARRFKRKGKYPEKSERRLAEWLLKNCGRGVSYVRAGYIQIVYEERLKEAGALGVQDEVEAILSATEEQKLEAAV